MFHNQIRCTTVLCLIVAILSACGAPILPPTPAPPKLADELVFYNWAEDMPQSVLDAFTTQFGVKVSYLTYQTQEEAVANIKAGKQYDIAVIEHEYIPALVADGLLAEIDLRNVSNFKNISANFRDLVTDPGNRHTVPYHYGSTGLLVRTDLVPQPVTSWADLWSPHFAGKIALRLQMREIIGLTLVTLGYSFNSENPQELERVEEHLLVLKPSISFVDVEAASAIPKLLSGEYVILEGWAEDFRLAHKENKAIAYILPKEGIALWADNYVVSANSPNKYTAELFVNFLLRPEISAQMVNEKYYATANIAAVPFIKPEILNDPVIFPPAENLRKAFFYQPLSPAGQKLYGDLWERFITAR